MSPSSTPLDLLLDGADRALRTLFARPRAQRSVAAPLEHDSAMTAADKAQSGALMRVNHVGEVCAQALYSGQALATRSEVLRRHFERAAAEETDHLAWTQQRLDALGARASLLNPLWYGASFGLGLLAGKLGDRASLGFVVETERQVEAHLQSHLERLPASDLASRAVVEAMIHDEAAHAADAIAAGAAELPRPVKRAMAALAGVMTRTAHYI